jgi:hypothetical protein
MNPPGNDRGRLLSLWDRAALTTRGVHKVWHTSRSTRADVQIVAAAVAQVADRLAGMPAAPREAT